MKIGRCLHWFGLLALALAPAGCRVIDQTAKAPVKAVNAVLPTVSKPPAPDPAALQFELQRLGDKYVSQTAVALDEYVRLLGTPEANRQALTWKVSVSSAAVGLASSPNPLESLLDFLGLATMTRTVLEEVWVKTTNGPAFQPWLNVSRTLETNAWSLAQRFLTSEQLDELRAAIQRSWEANPDARSSFFMRPEEFSTVVRTGAQRTSRPGSVFALVGLDPTAGLDPAVREVTRTRLFAERAMYVAQRAPFLLRWQTELLTDHLLQQPQIDDTLNSIQQVGRTAAELPDRLAAERQAILTALEQQEGKLRDLSAEVTRTLAAGEKMSGSLNTTLLTLDALMKRFGVGEPPTGPPDTNAVPFRISDYAETAGRVEQAAARLTELLRTADQTVGSTNLAALTDRIGSVVAQAELRGKDVVDYAFWRGVLLVGFVFVAAAAYRLIVVRSAGARNQPRSP